MKRVAVFLAAALIATFPMIATAQDHGSHGKKHGTDAKKSEHGTHSHAGHGDAHDNMIMIGEQSLSGVEGMAHINDIRAAMAKMNMQETHHFVLMFSDKDGAIETGTAAVRITDPGGSEGDTIRLMAMDGHFGADLVLDQKGEYLFKVGTRLPDGKTRQFEFRHTLD